MDPVYVVTTFRDGEVSHMEILSAPPAASMLAELDRLADGAWPEITYVVRSGYVNGGDTREVSSGPPELG